MPSFVKGGGTYTDPFGPNEYRRSTKGLKYESYTVAASTVPTETINGVAGQKVLQRGEVLAKITSGPEAGKVGPFMAGTPVQEVVTATVAGAPAGGTWRVSYRGTSSVTTLPYNATAAQLQAAINSLPSIVNEGQSVVVTGSTGGPYTITFQDPGDAGTLTIDQNSLTGGTNPTVGFVVTTGGTGGTGTGAATDGRSDVSNIVGVNDTYLPWQLLNHDEQISACYDGELIQAWCFIRNAAGARVPLDDGVARFMTDRKHLHVHFQ